MMSPFFPQGKQRSISHKGKHPALAVVKSRIDSPFGSPSPPPQHKNYQYYSKNSATARKLTLNKWESKLTKNLEVESIGLASTETLPATHPFHGTRTVEERRKYWNTLPIYSGSSLRNEMPSKRKQKRQVSRAAFLGRADGGDAPELTSTVQEGIQCWSNITGEKKASVTTLNTAEDRAYGQDGERGVITTDKESPAMTGVYDVSQSSVTTFNTSGDGQCGRNEESGVVTSGDEHPEQHPNATGKSSLFNTLLCRPSAFTPSFEQQVSRLPVRVAATLPARLKMKTGWGRKRQVVHFDMQQQVESGPAEAASSSTFAFDKRLPILSHRSSLPGSTGSGRSTSLAPTIRSRPHSASRTPSPTSTSDGVREALQAMSRVTRSSESQASESDLFTSLSLEERLRLTTLDDLPLGEGGAQRISQLMHDIERDRYGTWPQPKPRRTAENEEPRRIRRTRQIEPFEQTVQKVRARLTQLNDEAARQLNRDGERRAQRRRLAATARRQEVPSTVPSSPPFNPSPTLERPPTRRARPRTLPCQGRVAGFVDPSGMHKPALSSSLRHVMSIESLSDAGVQSDASNAETITVGLALDGDDVEDDPFDPPSEEDAVIRDV